MITVTEVCRTIIHADPVAFQAMAGGVLNLSAYAEQIVTKVEEKTHKKVRKGTVVVALSRIGEEILGSTLLQPKIQLDDVSMRSPLCDVTYLKTPENGKKLMTLHQTLNIKENAFFTVTQSMTEITIIAPESLLEDIKAHFNGAPKAVFTNLTGITVRFSKEYLEVPNVLYVIQGALAAHGVNFTEIISTYTEFSFIIEKKHVEVAMQALQKFLV